MPLYRTSSEIDFGQPVCIQQQAVAAQFGDTLPSDDQLVFENGVWKYDGQATAGAIDLPRGGRLRALVADLGAGGATWTGYIKGNPSNTTGEPYPSDDAALYAEGLMVFGASEAAGQYVNVLYGRGEGPAFLPGQRLYLVTLTATNPLMRIWIDPPGIETF